MADAPSHVAWGVVVAHDEPLARLRLRTLVARDARVAVVAEREVGARTLAPLAARAAAGLPAPAVVFVTGYDVHTARAFDLDAVDYLVQPVDVDRIRRLGSCGHGEYVITLADGATRTSSRRHGAPSTPSCGDASPHALRPTFRPSIPCSAHETCASVGSTPSLPPRWGAGDAIALRVRWRVSRISAP